jgi:uncharacterized protein (DUF2235 family)
MKRIVICCDGTWNERTTPRSARSRAAGLPWSAGDTNVAKIHAAIRQADPGELFQQSHYLEGIGTGSTTWARLAGGAFGDGLSGHVQDAYKIICQTYQEGDELWFFGFSRGAFTVRSLVGLISTVGVLQDVDQALAKRAYRIYREGNRQKRRQLGVEFRSDTGAISIEQLDIRFLGVWDTVGSVGVPVLGPRSFIARRRWGFHNVELSPRVKNACQALAIDEERVMFPPCVWKVPEDASSGQEVRQVWFAGCHSDVGGGAGDLALRWMMGRAEEAGMKFSPDLGPYRVETALPDLHNSMSFGAGLLGRYIRPVCRTGYDEGALHGTVRRRMEEQAYRPESLEMLPDGRHGRRASRLARVSRTIPGLAQLYLQNEVSGSPH